MGTWTQFQGFHVAIVCLICQDGLPGHLGMRITWTVLWLLVPRLDPQRLNGALAKGPPGGPLSRLQDW